MKLSKIFGFENDMFVRGLAFIAVVMFFAMGLLLWSNAREQKRDDAPNFKHAALSIQRGDGGYVSYKVEVASTVEEQMYGLMYRHELAPDAGMIFIYNADQPISMWMKNTYIPLDMLFVRADGKVVKIITHARPLDLTPLSSGEPIRAVIELNAGDAEKNDLKIGDKVLFSAFSGQGVK